MVPNAQAVSFCLLGVRLRSSKPSSGASFPGRVLSRRLLVRFLSCLLRLESGKSIG